MDFQPISKYREWITYSQLEWFPLLKRKINRNKSSIAEWHYGIFSVMCAIFVAKFWPKKEPLSTMIKFKKKILFEKDGHTSTPHTFLVHIRIKIFSHFQLFHCWELSSWASPLYVANTKFQPPRLVHAIGVYMVLPEICPTVSNTLCVKITMLFVPDARVI